MKFPWAFPKAKIICVDAEFDRTNFHPLVVGKTYTIRSLHEPPKNCPPNKLYYGSVLSVKVYGMKFGFAIERFRPVTGPEVEKLKQSIRQKVPA